MEKSFYIIIFKSTITMLWKSNRKGIFGNVINSMIALGIGFIILFFFLSIMLPTAFDRALEVNESSTGAYGNLSEGLTTLAEESTNLVPIAFAIMGLVLLFVAYGIYKRFSG